MSYAEVDTVSVKLVTFLKIEGESARESKAEVDGLAKGRSVQPRWALFLRGRLR